MKQRAIVGIALVAIASLGCGGTSTPSSPAVDANVRDGGTGSAPRPGNAVPDVEDAEDARRASELPPGYQPDPAYRAGLAEILDDGKNVPTMRAAGIIEIFSTNFMGKTTRVLRFSMGMPEKEHVLRYNGLYQVQLIGHDERGKSQAFRLGGIDGSEGQKSCGEDPRPTFGFSPGSDWDHIFFSGNDPCTSRTSKVGRGDDLLIKMRGRLTNSVGQGVFVTRSAFYLRWPPRDVGEVGATSQDVDSPGPSKPPPPPKRLPLPR